MLDNIIYEILDDSDSGREEHFERFDLENYGPSENKRNPDIIHSMMFDIRCCAELSAIIAFRFPRTPVKSRCR